jgi:tetratricopeptide (TPR) repeat protein
VAWTVFLLHSAIVQYLTIDGQREVKRALATYWSAGGTLTPAGHEELRHGVMSLERVEAIGLTAPANMLVVIASGHSHLGNQQAAMKYYGRAVEIEPRFASARFSYARHLAAAGQRDEPIEQMEHAVKQKPDLPGAAETLSALLLESGRGEQARTLLQEHRLRRPHDVETRLAYGVVLAHLGHIDQGLEETRAVLAEDANQQRAHFNLGQILAKSHQFASSLAALERAIELDPLQIKGRVLYTKVAAQLQDWDRLPVQFNWLRSHEPFNAEYVGGGALTLAKTGGLTEAIAEAEAVRDGDRSARFPLAYLYQAAGR